MFDLTEAINVRYEDGTCEKLYGTCENVAGLLLCTYKSEEKDSGTENLRIIKEFRPGPGGAMTVVFYLEFRARRPLAPCFLEIPLGNAADAQDTDAVTDSMPLCGKMYYCEIADSFLKVNAEAGCPDEIKGPLFVTAVSGSRAESRRLSILAASERMKKKWWKND